MPRWRVMVVEDDESVASLHRRLVDQTPGFKVVALARNAEEAVAVYRSAAPHLVLLDLTLPGASGIDLARRLRAAGLPVEIIALTAARDAATVRSMLQLGVVEYLVKPFTPERLRQSLTNFLHRVRAPGREELEQEAVDEMSSAGRNRSRWLPRGLSEERLSVIRQALISATEPLSAEEVGAATGIARVTARRYLEYMTATQTATCVLSGSRVGRPRKLYEITLDTANP